MRRIITIVISALLMFSIIGLLLSEGSTTYEPITLEYFLNCLADYNVDFSGIVALIDNVKSLIDKLIGIVTFTSFDPFGLLVDILVKPIQVIVLLVQNIWGLISETFILLTKLLQYR